MNNMFILILLFTCALTAHVTLDQQWKLWKSTNNRKYSQAEEIIRRKIWEDNLRIVRKHNVKADLGVYTYWLGMNGFADLTVNEFMKVIGASSNVTSRVKDSINHDRFAFNPNNDLPDYVDWRTKGCVDAVKDQGQCESDIIIAIVDAIEGLYCVATGKLLSLSYQQVIDCSGVGCTRGSPEELNEYLVKAGGLEDERSYPTFGTVNPCHFDPSKIAAKVTGYVDVKSRDETALQLAVATIGPIAVVIDASHSSFQLYKRGIYNEARCSPTNLDHAVLVVGYGTEGGTDYWLVKNSWGTSWGEQGYIQMSRNKNNQCGIATMASYATL